ncbi:ketosteroid isomerase-like protein [Nocardia mexicana]|uniref:Ketosteroid isomerase-like protein n=1 Tax=Nocardia mexicana TaxID=279262 RepID=A0A370HDN7_9NOCA|nr:ketosteroid isomerase-like protein [Nocardia mexicana]
MIAAGTPAAAHPVGPPTPGGPEAPSEDPVDGPTNLDTLTATVRPDHGYLTGVTVEFDRTSRTETGEKPAPATQFVFLFDKSIRFHPDRFPTCDRTELTRNGPAACPPGAQVGSGTAEIYPGAIADVAVFNTRYGSGERGVLITIPATGAVLANTLEPVDTGYRTDYATGLDELLPSPLPPHERSATTRFRVTFGATHTDHTGTHSFLESLSLPGQPLTFGLWSHFVTGQTSTPTDSTERPPAMTAHSRLRAQTTPTTPAPVDGRSRHIPRRELLRLLTIGAVTATAAACTAEPTPAASRVADRAMDAFDTGWRSGDWQPFLQMLTPEFSFWFPDDPARGRFEGVEGRRAIEEWTRFHGRNGNRVQGTRLRVRADGNHVSYEYESRGISESTAAYRNWELIIVEVRGDRISALHEYWGHARPAECGAGSTGPDSCR